MNASAEGCVRDAGSAGQWAGAFGTAAFAEPKARDACPVPPLENAPRAGAGAVLVGHSSPLVETGLLATLRRLTRHDVATLEELSALPAGQPWGRNIDVVVGDPAVAGRLAKFAADRDGSGGQAGPRILLIGADAGSSPLRQDSPASFDARLALECRQRDLVDTVNALIGSGAPAMPVRSPGVSAGNGKGQPDATAMASVGGATHRIEGIPLHAPRKGAANPPSRGGLPPGALRRVREAMERRLAEKLELTELAAVAGVSRSHFARAFKESVGQPPHRYLMTRRVTVASGLIRDTDRSLTDISMELGFFDQSHFVRVFARITGESPSAYRRKHR